MRASEARAPGWAATRVPFAVVTRIWLVTQLISTMALVPSEHGSDAGVEPLQVTIVSEPWAAPFTVAELASAVQLRLARAKVGVVAGAPPDDASERSVTVRWLDTPALRVERGSGDAVELPLRDAGRIGADVAQVTRRAALFIALFAEQATPLPQLPLPDDFARPSGEPSARRTVPEVAAGAAPRTVPPSVASPDPVAVSSQRAARAGWSLSAQFGPALAFEDGRVAATEALTVRTRRYLSHRTAVEIGAKLSGEYSASLESQSVGVADRAFFAGMAYDAWLSPSVAIDLGVAFQYTYPIVDIDGIGPVTSLNAPNVMRLAVRTSAGVAWSPAEHFTVGFSISPAFSFREREYVDDTGREVLSIGSMILEVTAGAGVRW